MSADLQKWQSMMLNIFGLKSQNMHDMLIVEDVAICWVHIFQASHIE